MPVYADKTADLAVGFAGSLSVGVLVVKMSERGVVLHTLQNIHAVYKQTNWGVLGTQRYEGAPGLDSHGGEPCSSNVCIECHVSFKLEVLLSGV